MDAGGTRHGGRLGARSEHQPTSSDATLRLGLEKSAALTQTQKHRSVSVLRAPTDSHPDQQSARSRSQIQLRAKRFGRPRAGHGHGRVRFVANAVVRQGGSPGESDSDQARACSHGLA
jgi:hypothetical protein